MGRHPLFTLAQKQLDTSSQSKNIICDNFQCDCKNCDHCGFRLDLQAGHFVTMALLSWPYTKCGGTNGTILAQTVSQSMVNCGEVLQNEVNQLQQQWASILGYMQMCDNCQSNV